MHLLFVFARLNRSKCLHPHKEGMESTNAHLHTQTHVFIHAGTHKCAHQRKKTMHCGATTKWQPTHRSFLRHAHADTRAHTGECGVYATRCMWTGSVNAVKRVWWLREPEHTRCNPICTLLVKQTASGGYTARYRVQSARETMSSSSKQVQLLLSILV